MNWKNWINRFRKKKTEIQDTSGPETIINLDILVCKNCDTEFKGNYCPHCGQIVKEFNRPFSFLIYDFMGTMFAFDARFFKTLKAVLFQPGQFSQDYMNGKRASYMKPFQFYVFVSFVFFLLLNIQTNRFIHIEDSPTSSIQDTTAMDQFSPELTLSEIDTKDNNLDVNIDLFKDGNHKENKNILSTENVEKFKEQVQKELDKNNHSDTQRRMLQNTIKMLSYPDVFVTKHF